MALNVYSLRTNHPPSPSKASPRPLLSKQHHCPFSCPNRKSGRPACHFPPLLIPQPVTPRSHQFFFCWSSWFWSSSLAQPGPVARHPPHCSPVPVQSFLILLCTVAMMMLLKCKPDPTTPPSQETCGSKTLFPSVGSVGGVSIALLYVGLLLKGL